MNIKIKKTLNSKAKYNLICGDALGLLPEIKDSSIDHCITDPPYNISGYDHKRKIGWLQSNGYWKEKKNFNKINEKWDSFSNSSYENFTSSWLEEVFRIIKPNGNIIIFGSHHNIFTIGNLLNKKNKKILNFITWFKRNAFPNITHRLLCNSTEYIIWAVNNSQKEAKKWVFNYDALKKLNPIKRCKKCKKTLGDNFIYCPFCGGKNLSVDYTQMRDMWNILNTPKRERKHGKHPSQKPFEVVRRLILGATNKNEVILDPFMGSGTVPLVAKKYKRRFIAIDNKREYCKLALKRLNSTEQLTLESI